MKEDKSTIHCNSIEDVRQNIDALDSQIVALIAKRSLFVKEAARFKNTTQEVKADNRVKAVIAKVRLLATDNNVSPDIVEQVYRTMIDAFINYELNEFEKK